MSEQKPEKQIPQPSQSEQLSQDLAGDMLVGAESIAIYTGWTRRRVFHLVEKSQLPCFKIGGVIHARKSTLLHWIARMEQQTLEHGKGEG